jgi:hypothetical protein
MTGAEKPDSRRNIVRHDHASARHRPQCAQAGEGQKAWNSYVRCPQNLGKTGIQTVATSAEYNYVV